MKIHSRLILSGLAVAVLLAIAFTRSSHADIIITEAQTSAIKTHCVENQAGLNQLHQTDAFLRIDRGNLYRTISDKLMVPLNRRIAANRLDGGKLVEIAAKFDNQYKDFYDAYIAYDTALSNLLKIDCTKEPVAFYNALLSTRSTRKTLSESNQKLVQLAKDYKTEFNAFKADFLAKQDKS